METEGGHSNSVIKQRNLCNLCLGMHDSEDDKSDFEGIDTRKDAEEESAIIETKSVSEDSTQICHRISTTIAEIHDSPRRRPVQFDNRSPVLIPRVPVRRFGRLSGRAMNVLETSGERINQVPTHIAEQSNNQDNSIVEPDTDGQRLLTASELTVIRINETSNTEVVNTSGTGHQEDAVEEGETEITDIQKVSSDCNKEGMGVASKERKFPFLIPDEELFEPLAHSSEKSINEDLEPVEEMREARGSGVNVSGHGETEQTSPVLAFETRKSADRLENVSSDSTEINASIEGENGTSVEHNIQNLRRARILDEFWSVSPMEVNIEDLPKNNSNSNKRRTDSRDEAPSRKKKKMKDAATHMTKEDKQHFKNVRKGLYLINPLVFKLCRCRRAPEHVCS
ncbi:uncharacterized protein LOC134752522 [Cydia strobilella]|uniref:uncharacterized protein LOC134752522 n=1 Tax=Cydia strobilella TaxID=1100964 RepID=UPI0030058759